MLLVVDANFLMAALIKDSTTRKLLMSEELTLIAPEFLLEEIEKYSGYLSEKTKLEENLIKELLSEVVEKAGIKIYPAEEFKAKLNEASELSPDPKDLMYFALALKEKAIIWSNDKELKKQNKAKIITTEELKKEIG
jgi:predicted nucleic acid-binding protein